MLTGINQRLCRPALAVIVAIFTRFINIHIMMGMLNQPAEYRAHKVLGSVFQQCCFPVPLHAAMASSGIMVLCHCASSSGVLTFTNAFTIAEINGVSAYPRIKIITRRSPACK